MVSPSLESLLKNPEKLIKKMSVSDLEKLEKELKSELCYLFPFWKLRQLKILIKQIRKEKFVEFR